MPRIIIPLCDPVPTGSWAFHGIQSKNGSMNLRFYTKFSLVVSRGNP